ncbi:MAG: hypothetical protein HN509_17325 [Halobacteriovoraceae bacterium]|jgi:hypothetical protein|nr:hypothetical protein [Halobacteriovoraceae bacterium]MBT5094542.1 hypothetical protein [Halobacteriovoraceae bacterium]
MIIKRRRGPNLHDFTLFLVLLGLVGLFSSSCVENGGVRAKKSSTKDGVNGSNGGGSNGPGAGPGDGGLGGADLEEFPNGITELRHIIDPFDGNYKTKVTIPKNFKGYLYLSGLNVTALNEKVVKVRFNFGRELEPIIIPAVIGRGTGITPQTDIEVLILDMNNQPFNNIRLLYDLFDYNDYRDTSGDEVKTPTLNPRNGGLFCRGLKLEDDPTFQGSSANGFCDSAGEKCNYAYAKVVDSGLLEGGIAKLPTEPQIDISGNGYASESLSTSLKKCLPDNNDRANFFTSVNQTLTGAGSMSVGENVIFGATTFTYNGPFRPLAESQWEIRTGAYFSEVSSSTPATGLFQKTMDTTANGGINSFLFPRVFKMNLTAGVSHLSSITPFDLVSTASNDAVRGLDPGLVVSTSTSFMAGCNGRVTNFDEFTNEGIGSCNVSATIEILSRDIESGRDVVLSTSKDVKIQLIRPSLTNFEGNEVLYSAMNACSNSQACGANTCCFNQRCWGKDIVSQCLEDANVIGNGGVGAVCSSDFQCSSLCCNQSTGTCAVHLNSADQKVFCSKSPGQSCVAKEYCRQENVPNCFIVKTGLDQQGTPTCALRCYNVPTHGECRNGICIPPSPPGVPIFDPLNPDCTDAIDPPTFPDT